MFLYNIKINTKRIFNFSFILVSTLVITIISVLFYHVYFKSHSLKESDETLTLEDSIKKDAIFELTNENYSTILQTVNNDIDSYVGCKIHYTGYIYRLIDFDKTEFVLARNMVINESTNQSVIVGFLCTFDNADSFPDGTWVDITGIIEKGNYYGDIAQIKVENMFQCEKPENEYVSQPDDTYIPTSSIL